MKYQEYINLGFERTDMNDSVEFRNTGYYGYSLEKKINDRMMICVSGGELDNPKLYIKKSNQETYNIVKITPEIVFDFLHEDTGFDYRTMAC